MIINQSLIFSRRAFTGKDTTGVKTTIKCSKRASKGGLSDRVGFFQTTVEKKQNEQILSTPKHIRSRSAPSSTSTVKETPKIEPKNEPR